MDDDDDLRTKIMEAINRWSLSRDALTGDLADEIMDLVEQHVREETAEAVQSTILDLEERA